MRPTSGNRQRGFTLIELLVVIGIIAVLVSILIPAVGSVRRAAQTASTRQMFSRIDAAILMYNGDYSAMPGVFPNDQLKPFSTGYHALGGQQLTWIKDDAVSASSPLLNVTSSENLFLSLTGGIQRRTGSPQFAYNEQSAREARGPLALAGLARKSSAYMPVTPRETTLDAPNVYVRGLDPGLWNPGSGGFAGDTVVPEYVDGYSSPSPILFMRANKGASGVVGSGVGPFGLGDVDGTYNNVAFYEYEALTGTYSNVLAFVYNGGQTATYQQAWPTTGDETTEFERAYPDRGNPVTLARGWPSYLGNATQNGIAQRDGYILISAGPDGRYGTKDDITNFR